MKLITITLAALLSLASIKSHANEVKVSPAVLQSFKTEFVNATEIKWSESNNIYKAEFYYAAQYVAAYFDENGEMIAVTKNISSHELPLSLQKSLKKFYTNYWITNLFELTDASGTNYYLTVENADTRITLKSNSTYGWSVYLKSNKS